MVDIVSKTPVIKPEDVTIDDLQHLSKDSFALWCLTSGAKIDHNPVEFEHHRYLLPLYMDNSPEIVLGKAAQVGATAYQVLRMIWWLYNHPGRKGALYLPNDQLAQLTSKDRIAPLIQSIPPVAAIAGQNDNLNLRKIGDSAFYIFHMGGVSSKDSIPLDYLTFDEVRLMPDADVDQTLERISHSPYKMKVFMSTVGLPNQNIHLRYLGGTQHVWHSRCGCNEGVDLARTFPDCVVADDPRRPGEVYLRCPKCRWEIKDAQNGRYVPHNPGAEYNSYHVSQLASKFISTKEIWTAWQRTRNISEFYNAKLGLPYVDVENQGVSMAQIQACIDETRNWMVNEPYSGVTCMGVDQGGGYLMPIVGSMESGKKVIRHVEIIERDNPQYRTPSGEKVSPFERLAEMMEEFNVKLCVVDALPNLNDALQFAQRFPGRVFLAYYQKSARELVQWGDRKKFKETIRKAGPLLKFKHLCVLSRYSSMDFALGEWRDSNVICPHPDRLVQMAYDEKTAQLMPESPCYRLFNHMTSLYKQFHETNEETGEGEWRWVHSGNDHLAHSWNYLNVALERQRRSTLFTFA